MKKDLHPKNYRFVVFEDLNNGFRFITRSTTSADETTKWDDGNEYPLVKVHISSTSHPFFTGEERIIDIEGGKPAVVDSWKISEPIPVADLMK